MMIPSRPRRGSPRVPEIFEGVAPFDQRHALRGQALEFDGFHFGAILLRLRIALCHLVVIEQAAHTLGLAVEEVGDAPEEIGEIGFQTGLSEEACGGFEDRRQRLLGSFGEGRGRASPSSSSGR
jgi:hypothetical protein